MDESQDGGTIMTDDVNESVICISDEESVIEEAKFDPICCDAELQDVFEISPVSEIHCDPICSKLPSAAGQGGVGLSPQSQIHPASTDNLPADQLPHPGGELQTDPAARPGKDIPAACEVNRPVETVVLENVVESRSVNISHMNLYEPETVARPEYAGEIQSPDKPPLPDMSAEVHTARQPTIESQSLPQFSERPQVHPSQDMNVSSMSFFETLDDSAEVSREVEKTAEEVSPVAGNCVDPPNLPEDEVSSPSSESDDSGRDSLLTDLLVNYAASPESDHDNGSVLDMKTMPSALCKESAANSTKIGTGAGDALVGAFKETEDADSIGASIDNLIQNPIPNPDEQGGSSSNNPIVLVDDSVIECDSDRFEECSGFSLSADYEPDITILILIIIVYILIYSFIYICNYVEDILSIDVGDAIGNSMENLLDSGHDGNNNDDVSVICVDDESFCGEKDQKVSEARIVEAEETGMPVAMDTCEEVDTIPPVDLYEVGAIGDDGYVVLHAECVPRIEDNQFEVKGTAQEVMSTVNEVAPKQCGVELEKSCEGQTLGTPEPRAFHSVTFASNMDESGDVNDFTTQSWTQPEHEVEDSNSDSNTTKNSLGVLFDFHNRDNAGQGNTNVEESHGQRQDIGEERTETTAKVCEVVEPSKEEQNSKPEESSLNSLELLDDVSDCCENDEFSKMNYVQNQDSEEKTGSCTEGEVTEPAKEDQNQRPDKIVAQSSLNCSGLLDCLTNCHETDQVLKVSPNCLQHQDIYEEKNETAAEVCGVNEPSKPQLLTPENVVQQSSRNSLDDYSNFHETDQAMKINVVQQQDICEEKTEITAEVFEVRGPSKPHQDITSEEVLRRSRLNSLELLDDLYTDGVSDDESCDQHQDVAVEETEPRAICVDSTEPAMEQQDLRAEVESQQAGLKPNTEPEHAINEASVNLKDVEDVLRSHVDSCQEDRVFIQEGGSCITQNATGGALNDEDEILETGVISLKCKDEARHSSDPTEDLEVSDTHVAIVSREGLPFGNEAVEEESEANCLPSQQLNENAKEVDTVGDDTCAGDNKDEEQRALNSPLALELLQALSQDPSGKIDSAAVNTHLLEGDCGPAAKRLGEEADGDEDSCIPEEIGVLEMSTDDDVENCKIQSGASESFGASRHLAALSEIDMDDASFEQKSVNGESWTNEDSRERFETANKWTAEDVLPDNFEASNMSSGSASCDKLLDINDKTVTNEHQASIGPSNELRLGTIQTKQDNVLPYDSIGSLKPKSIYEKNESNFKSQGSGVFSRILKPRDAKVFDWNCKSWNSLEQLMSRKDLDAYCKSLTLESGSTLENFQVDVLRRKCFIEERSCRQFKLLSDRFAKYNSESSEGSDFISSEESDSDDMRRDSIGKLLCSDTLWKEDLSIDDEPLDDSSRQSFTHRADPIHHCHESDDDVIDDLPFDNDANDDIPASKPSPEKFATPRRIAKRTKSIQKSPAVSVSGLKVRISLSSTNDSTENEILDDDDERRRDKKRKKRKKRNSRSTSEVESDASDVKRKKKSVDRKRKTSESKRESSESKKEEAPKSDKSDKSDSVIAKETKVAVPEKGSSEKVEDAALSVSGKKKHGDRQRMSSESKSHKSDPVIAEEAKEATSEKKERSSEKAEPMEDRSVSGKGKHAHRRRKSSESKKNEAPKAQETEKAVSDGPREKGSSEKVEHLEVKSVSRKEQHAERQRKSSESKTEETSKAHKLDPAIVNKEIKKATAEKEVGSSEKAEPMEAQSALGKENEPSAVTSEDKTKNSAISSEDKSVGAKHENVKKSRFDSLPSSASPSKRPRMDPPKPSPPKWKLKKPVKQVKGIEVRKPSDILGSILNSSNQLFGRQKDEEHKAQKEEQKKSSSESRSSSIPPPFVPCATQGYNAPRQLMPFMASFFQPPSAAISPIPPFPLIYDPYFPMGIPGVAPHLPHPHPPPPPPPPPLLLQEPAHGKKMCSRWPLLQWNPIRKTSMIQCQWTSMTA